MYCHTCVSWSKLCRHRSPFLSFCFVCGVSWSLLPFFGTNPVGLAESFHDPSKVRHSHPVKSQFKSPFFLKKKWQGQPFPYHSWDWYIYPHIYHEINHPCRKIYRSSHGSVMGLDSCRFSWPRRWSWAKGYGFPLWDLFVNQITRSRSRVEFWGFGVLRDGLSCWWMFFVQIFANHGSYCSEPKTR